MKIWNAPLFHKQKFQVKLFYTLQSLVASQWLIGIYLPHPNTKIQKLATIAENVTMIDNT